MRPFYLYRYFGLVLNNIFKAIFWLFIIILIYTMIYWIGYIISFYAKRWGNHRKQRNLLKNINDPDARIKKIQELYEQGIFKKVGTDSYNSLMYLAYIEKEDYEAAAAYIHKKDEKKGKQSDMLDVNYFTFFPVIFMGAFLIIFEDIFPVIKTKEKQERLIAEEEASFLNNMVLCFIKNNRIYEAELYLSKYDEFIRNNDVKTCNNFDEMVILNHLQHANLLIAKGQCNDAIPYLQKIKSDKNIRKSLRYNLMLLEAQVDIHNGNKTEAKIKLAEIMKNNTYSPIMNEAKRILESFIQSEEKTS